MVTAILRNVWFEPSLLVLVYLFLTVSYRRGSYLFYYEYWDFGENNKAYELFWTTVDSPWRRFYIKVFRRRIIPRKKRFRKPFMKSVRVTVLWNVVSALVWGGLIYLSYLQGKGYYFETDWDEKVELFLIIYTILLVVRLTRYHSKLKTKFDLED